MHISPITKSRPIKPNYAVKKQIQTAPQINNNPADIQKDKIFNINPSFKPSFGVNFSEDEYRKKLQDRCFKEAMFTANSLGVSAMMISAAGGAYTISNFKIQSEVMLDRLAKDICDIYDVPLKVRNDCITQAQMIAGMYVGQAQGLALGGLPPAIAVPIRIINSGNMCIVTGYRIARACEDYAHDRCIAIRLLNPVYEKELKEVAPREMKNAIKEAKKEINEELKAEKAKTGLKAKVKYQVAKQAAAAKIKMLDAAGEKLNKDPEILIIRK